MFCFVCFHLVLKGAGLSLSVCLSVSLSDAHICIYSTGSLCSFSASANYMNVLLETSQVNTIFRIVAFKANLLSELGVLGEEAFPLWTGGTFITFVVRFSANKGNIVEVVPWAVFLSVHSALIVNLISKLLFYTCACQSPTPPLDL